MKKRILSLLSVLLITALLTSPVSAGGSVGLSRVQFSLGSLIASGDVKGLGNTDVLMVLDASGTPLITCTNNGGNSVPGQSSPKISASGSQFLDGNSPVRKNGKSPFGVETVDPQSIPWDQAGCPNANWLGHIDFIFWTDATISVLASSTGDLLFKQDYKCTTTLTSVSCTPK
ncbi:MAG TPA: hypothetical protein VK249_24485 [Anaerolineales bacterium]|nr:hypothetical protein [Anaerolineales bacterium]